MEIHKTCGNVFSDIGFPPEEAANLLFPRYSHGTVDEDC
jgi:hypothetical protein